MRAGGRWIHHGREPLHVAAWIELQTQTLSAPTVKQHLAAIRHLFDWLVTGQVVPHNPAASVRGPSHSARQGKTTVLDATEARQLQNQKWHDYFLNYLLSKH